MTSESYYSRFKSYISGASTDYANDLSRFTAQMEFTVMKLKDLQESYSNYEPKHCIYAIKIQRHSTNLVCISYDVILYHNFLLKRTNLLRCTLVTQYYTDKDNIFNI